MSSPRRTRGLTVQWNIRLPAEMQERLMALSAKLSARRRVPVTPTDAAREALAHGIELLEARS